MSFHTEGKSCSRQTASCHRCRPGLRCAWPKRCDESLKMVVSRHMCSFNAAASDERLDNVYSSIHSCSSLNVCYREARAGRKHNGSSMILVH